MAGYGGRDAVIVEAVRTPIGKGKPNGALATSTRSSSSPTPCARSSTAPGVDPALIDDVIGGTVDQVGEQAMNTTRYAVLSRGLPRDGPGDHGGPPVRLLPAGRALRRAGRHLGGVRHGRRLRCGVDEPGADVVERAAGQRPLRARGRRALPRGPRAAGHQRRAHRRQVGHPASGWTPSRGRHAARRPRPGTAGCSTPRSRPWQGVTRDEMRPPRQHPRDTRRASSPPTTTRPSPSASRRSTWYVTAGNAQPRSTTAPPPCSSRPARPRPASACARSPGCTASPSPVPTRC